MALLTHCKIKSQILLGRVIKVNQLIRNNEKPKAELTHLSIGRVKIF